MLQSCSESTLPATLSFEGFLSVGCPACVPLVFFLPFCPLLTFAFMSLAYLVGSVFRFLNNCAVGAQDNLSLAETYLDQLKSCSL